MAQLAAMVSSSKEEFDLVVGIARGGLPVAMVVSDHLGLKVDFINVKSYSGIGTRTRPRILTTITERIGGKRVLLVDDIVDEGDTLKWVTRYLLTMNPKVVRTAALFTKPWSAVKPDYSISTVDRWIVFPYERGEVRRLRSKSRSREEGGPEGRTAT